MARACVSALIRPAPIPARLLPPWRPAGGDRLQRAAGQDQPDFFPKVFGPEANEPLDRDAVVARFTAMADEVRTATGREMTPEQLAEGFLEIAVGNMAEAIKRISVQRGHDVTEYALTTFGGAGGQHACLVADALGMTTVFAHPLGGVLSAYGMGLPTRPTCARKPSSRCWTPR